MKYKKSTYFLTIALVLVCAAALTFSAILRADARSRQLGQGDSAPALGVEREESGLAVFLFGKRYTF